VLDAPVPLPRVFSPDNPFLLGRTPNLASSNGFEGMALSEDGKTLYPFLEGPLAGDDPLVRHVYEFDVSEREIVDLLHVNDKDGISENPSRPGDFGLGNPFKFPYQTVEAALPLSGNELAFVDDTNFGSTGPHPEPA
jgi:hypothetical protein